MIVKQNDEVSDLEFLEKFADLPENLVLWHEETIIWIQEPGFKFQDMVPYAIRSSTVTRR